MTTEPHLIFALHGSPYAVSALAVCEIIPLPELIPLTELPPYVAGVINLRGKVVPVIDLNLRMGQARQPYRVQDSVIVLLDGATLVGIIVNEVCRVRGIAGEEVEPPLALSLGRNDEPVACFVSGVAKVDDDLIMLLHLENVLRLPGVGPLAEPDEERINPTRTAEHCFCPQATPEERVVFRARAQGLRQPLANHDSSGLMPLAIVGLNGEYFGIDLAIVREFSTLRSVTPVPCCPPHVVGQMNLRGDILTLIDIRSALQMPLASTRKGNSNGSPGNISGQVVVVQSGAVLAGVLVDEVFDVVNLQPAEICAVPAAVRSQSVEFLKSTAPYKERMLSILDLPKILTRGALTVNDEV
ncbi:MAG TPA: chemotaxis protein CheW [Abditibacteriaceae bacterium]|jgi:purine-binding chemotaxis protein CheW